MVIKMVAFYVEKIKKGEITINDVPKLWRKKVQVILDSEENDGN